jgi:ABC-type hemin transport system substrate-binding protein
LDIIGKEVAEGLNEPDSIEALENDYEVDVTAVSKTPPTHKRRQQVIIFKTFENIIF